MPDSPLVAILLNPVLWVTLLFLAMWMVYSWRAKQRDKEKEREAEAHDKAHLAQIKIDLQRAKSACYIGWPKTCPKCGHVRQQGEAPQVPESQCPECGVFYAKYVESLKRQIDPTDIPSSIPPSGSQSADQKSEKSATKPTAQQAILGWAVLLIIIFIATQFFFGGSDNNSPEKLAHAAYFQCQDHMNTLLKSPGSAKYPYPPRVVRIGNTDQWAMPSYVDSQNGFGAMLRTHWTCVITIKNGTTTINYIKAFGKTYPINQ